MLGKVTFRQLAQHAAETPDPIKARQLTDEEALRVIKALDTPERRHPLPVFMAAMDTGERKSSLSDYLRWKDINFGDEIITLTAYKGKGRNIKPKRWPLMLGGFKCCFAHCFCWTIPEPCSVNASGCGVCDHDARPRVSIMDYNSRECDW